MILTMFVKSILVSLSTYYLANLVDYPNLTLVSGLVVGFYTFIYDNLERELKSQFQNIFKDVFVAYSNLLERNKDLSLEIESQKKENKMNKIYLRLKYLKRIISFQNKVNRCCFPFCEEIVSIPKPELNQERICEKHNQFTDKKCPICFEDNPEGLFHLKCMHRLHFKCFKKWMEIDESQEGIRCPVCRKHEPLI